jgi:hypothetical protein
LIAVDINNLLLVIRRAGVGCRGHGCRGTCSCGATRRGAGRGRNTRKTRSGRSDGCTHGAGAGVSRRSRGYRKSGRAGDCLCRRSRIDRRQIILSRTRGVGPFVEEIQRERSRIDVPTVDAKRVQVRPVCKAELSNKTEKSTRGTKLRYGHVASICDSGDVVGR